MNIWDKQYKKGQWDVLKDILEKERLEVTRNLIIKYSKGGTILEMGCGEGLLQAGLDKSVYLKYVGVDVSQIAISNSKHLQNENVRYECGDMESYIPSGKFDIIVFSESLYYSANPVALFERYRAFLNQNGKSIVSIFEDMRNLRIIDLLNSSYSYIDHMVSKNTRGIWHCLVY